MLRQRVLLFCVFSIMILFTKTGSWAAFPLPWQTGFQEAASPVMEKVTSLHQHLLIVISVIAAFISILIGFVVVRFSAKRQKVASKTTHHVWLEVIWTMIPVAIVVMIAVPSVQLIYFSDEEPKDPLNIKVTGHQWYWSYEYPDQDIHFDSYMIPDPEIKPGQYRLLEVDNRVVVPVGKPISIQLTSADVLHSWAIPSLGVKKDTVPGRLNQTWIQINKEGVYFGQCSELCGMKHGFMPIVVEAVSQDKFEAWLVKARSKFAACPAQERLALQSLTPVSYLIQGKNS